MIASEVSTRVAGVSTTNVVFRTVTQALSLIPPHSSGRRSARRCRAASLIVRRAVQAALQTHERKLPVFNEVRHLYLYFTDDVYKRDDVGLLSGAADANKAGRRLHVEGDRRQDSGCRRHRISQATRVKRRWRHRTSLQHRAGMNALQIYLPMMWSTGVKTKKITEEVRGGDRGKSRQADGPLPPQGTHRRGFRRRRRLWDPRETRAVRN